MRFFFKIAQRLCIWLFDTSAFIYDVDSNRKYAWHCAAVCCVAVTLSVLCDTDIMSVCRSWHHGSRCDAPRPCVTTAVLWRRRSHGHIRASATPSWYCTQSLVVNRTCWVTPKFKYILLTTRITAYVMCFKLESGILYSSWNVAVQTLPIDKASFHYWSKQHKPTFRWLRIIRPHVQKVIFRENRSWMFNVLFLLYPA